MTTPVEILQFLHYNPSSSRVEIAAALAQITYPADPTKESYTFSGWSVIADETPVDIAGHASV